MPIWNGGCATFLFFAEGREGEESGRSISEGSCRSATLRRALRFEDGIATTNKEELCFRTCRLPVSACRSANKRDIAIVEKWSPQCNFAASVCLRKEYQPQDGSNARDGFVYAAGNSDMSRGAVNGYMPKLWPRSGTGSIDKEW